MQSDEDILAEDLALAKRMLTGRSKHDIIDASYNRYNFHDQGLPEWFEADERKHMRAPKQVRVCMMRLLPLPFRFRSQTPSNV